MRIIFESRPNLKPKNKRNKKIQFFFSNADGREEKGKESKVRALHGTSVCKCC